MKILKTFTMKNKSTFEKIILFFAFLFALFLLFTGFRMIFYMIGEIFK